MENTVMRSYKRHFLFSTNLHDCFTIEKEYCLRHSFSDVERSVFLMNLLMVFFGLIAILSLVAVFRAIKDKNVLAIVFGLATVGVFGWFVVMTIFNQGYPPTH